MLRALCVCVLVVAVAGCAPAGQSPAASPPTPAQPTTAPAAALAETPAAAATAAPALNPTAVSTAASTDAPAQSPAAPRAMSEPVQQGFISLAMLHSAAGAVAQIARDVQSGGLDERAGADRLANLRETLKAVAAQFEQDAPDPSLADAWGQARAGVSALADIADRWLGRQITAAQAEGELKPLQVRLDQMLASAERGLTGQYGADPARLALIRQQMDQRIRRMR